MACARIGLLIQGVGQPFPQQVTVLAAPQRSNPRSGGEGPELIFSTDGRGPTSSSDWMLSYGTC
jgi:hypothetical protein